MIYNKANGDRVDLGWTGVFVLMGGMVGLIALCFGLMIIHPGLLLAASGAFLLWVCWSYFKGVVE